MKTEDESHPLFCMETVVVCLFFLGELLLFGLSRLDRYEMAVVLSAIFSFYFIVWGRAAFSGALFCPFFFLTCFIAISGYAIDGSVVDAATSSTTAFHVFAYSLLGAETYLIYTSYLHDHPERYKILKCFAYALTFGGVVVYFYCVILVAPRMGFSSVTLDLANISYAIMMPLPLFLFFTKENKQIPVLLTALAFAVFTAKRTAILTLIVTILLLLVLYRRKSHWIAILCLFAVAGIGCLTLGDVDLDPIAFAIERFENLGSDQGSGRLTILQIFWNALDDFSIEEFCFGRGFGQFLDYSSQIVGLPYVSAHNDLAEIMYAHGFFAVLCYVALSARIYFLIWKMRKSDHFASFILLGVEYAIYGLFANLFFFYVQTSIIFIMIALLDDQYQRHRTQETERIDS